MDEASETAEAQQPSAPPPEPAFAAYCGLSFLLSLKWLAAGASAYALLLLVTVAAHPRDAIAPILGPSIWLTPMFGLPLVIASFRMAGRTRRMLYFLLLLPIAHMAANYLAWSQGVASYDQLDPAGEYRRNLVTGAVGGAAGAVLSLTILHLLRLATHRRAELLAMLIATLALTAVGAAGMAQGLQWAGGLAGFTGQAGPTIIWFETVHLPWQLVFALVLAWLTRPLTRAVRAPA